MSVVKRDKTKTRILRFAKAHRLEVPEKRITFNANVAEIAPARPGVYRFFFNGELVYVGQAKNMKMRLKQHFVKSHNNELSTAILSGESQVDWRVLPAPFHEWWETLEILEHQESHDGEKPAFNKKVGGGLFG